MGRLVTIEQNIDYSRNIEERRRKHAERQKAIKQRRLFLGGAFLVVIVGFAILARAFGAPLHSDVADSSSISNLSNEEKTPPNTNTKPTDQTTDKSDTTDEADTTDEKPVNNYDFSKAVPDSNAVEDDYFDNAVFIGDSRTEGLLLNTGLSNAISYTQKGLMVDTVFTSPVVNKNGSKLPVMEALETTDFSKVYIMFGVNETGWPYNDVFIEDYSKIIDKIKTINPSAIIYVQEILPVSNTVSSTHSYIRNEKINEFNSLLREMAEEKQVYYIETASAVSSADGSLPEEAAVDGIHLKKDYCEKWLDYLKTHTVSE